MTSAEMLAEVKAVLHETVIDPAWGDSRLYNWLAEGQDKFCEDTGFFTDMSSFTITLSTGVAVYAIPSRVIQILDIFYGNRKLGKFQEEDRPSVATEWSPTYNPDASGLPTAWQADRETGYITFDKTPTASENGKILTLRVWRYALNELSATVNPEIPSRFHRAPIAWACYKALMDHDMEKQDNVKAADHLAEYNFYAREAKVFLRRYHGIETRVGVNSTYVV